MKAHIRLEKIIKQYKELSGVAPIDPSEDSKLCEQIFIALQLPKLS